MNKSISFIIPVFNAEKYIESALKSILNQFEERFEILVIDDGSTDSTLEILNKFSSNPNVIVFHQENSGVSSARNLGIENAKCELIIFLDADDMLNSNFKKEIKNINFDNIDLLISDYYSKNKEDSCNEKKIIKYTNKFEIIDSIISINYGLKNLNLLSKNNRCIGGKIFKRKIIIDNELRFDTNLATFEDGMFIIEYLMNSNKIYYWTYKFYFYRKVKMSATNSFYTDIISRRFKIIYKMEELFKKYNLDKSLAVNNFYFDEYRVILCNLFKTIGFCKTRKKLEEKNILEIYCKMNNLNIFSLSRKEKIIYFLIKNKLFFILYLIYFLK